VVVCLIIYGSIRTLTGGYLYDRMLMEHFERNGHSMHLMSLPMRRYPLGLADNLTQRLKERLQHAKPNLVLQDELCHPSLIALNRGLKTDRPMPIVSIVHHLYCSEKRRPLLNVIPTWIERRYLGTVDGFVFNSRTTCDSVFNLSQPPRPYVIAPPGGDRWGHPVRWHPKRAMGQGPMRLIYAGLVIPRKGLLPLIEALAQVSAQNWRLDVVGSLKMDRRYANRCRKLSARLGLAPRILFRGEIADSDLMEIMAEAHLLCMPFAYEGFGITTAEAMRCGVPVMGSTAGATRELIKHGGNGLLFDPGDIPGVAAALSQLAADRKRLNAMGRSAFEKAQSLPSWRVSMGHVEAFARQMAQH
jgi:glycosyltransferase involved in cell wall biosynthesis